MLLQQAYAERRDQTARQIGEVFRQAAAQQGYDTTELARLAGDSDLVTGARQVEHLMVAGRSRDTGMANALAKALRGRYLSPFPLWKPWGPWQSGTSGAVGGSVVLVVPTGSSSGWSAGHRPRYRGLAT
jgi:hypothetical protein